MNKVRYGNQVAEERLADGISGFLCKSVLNNYFFRVYEPEGSFTDYEIRHDDLQVTISAEAMASFYSVAEDRILDHRAEVLGLGKVDAE